MSKSSLIVGLFLVVAGLLFAVLLINSGNWDIALIAGLPPVALGSWIAVADTPYTPPPYSPRSRRRRMSSGGIF